VGGQRPHQRKGRELVTIQNNLILPTFKMSDAVSFLKETALNSYRP
jgi:hypothetical protein